MPRLRRAARQNSGGADRRAPSVPKCGWIVDSSAGASGCGALPANAAEPAIRRARRERHACRALRRDASSRFTEPTATHGRRSGSAHAQRVCDKFVGRQDSTIHALTHAATRSRRRHSSRGRQAPSGRGSRMKANKYDAHPRSAHARTTLAPTNECVIRSLPLRCRGLFLRTPAWREDAVVGTGHSILGRSLPPGRVGRRRMANRQRGR